MKGLKHHIVKGKIKLQRIMNVQEKRKIYMKSISKKYLMMESAKSFFNARKNTREKANVTKRTTIY